MLWRPVKSKMFVIMQKRPAFTSVTHGTRAALSLRSMLKTPDVFGPNAVSARVQTSTTRGSSTVLASAGVEDWPLGWLPPPK